MFFDPYDATYTYHGIFTESKLREIKDYNPIVLEDLPKHLVDFLTLFDCVCSIYGNACYFVTAIFFFNLMYSAAHN